MSTMYVVTEENYMEVLEKLQKICNKYHMISKYQCFKINHHTKKDNPPDSLITYERRTWGYRPHFYYDEDRDTWIREIKPYQYNQFVYVQKHSIREAYEQNPEDEHCKRDWDEIKALIHLDIDVCEVLVISVGDKVKFEKNRFTVYTDDSYLNLGKMEYLYKHTFYANRLSKIHDLNEAINNRNEEWQLEEERYAKMMEKYDED